MFTIPLSDDNPTTRAALVTWAIILVCALVFLWQAGLSPREDLRVTYGLGLVPAVLFGTAELPRSAHMAAPWLTIYTSMFLHGGWFHLIGNMWFLWIFGDNVEDALGRARYLVFYFLCGTAAALTQAMTHPEATEPMVGASGAIAGVLGAYIMLAPWANVRVLVWIIIFVRIINVPAVIVLGLWFAMQLFSGLATPMGGQGGVAFWAHIGGFLAGVLLVGLMRPRGVQLLRPQRTQAFELLPPSAFRRSSYRGSVPPAGSSPWRRGGPWR
jgi:membrane associated rhomboid family serine protease